MNTKNDNSNRQGPTLTSSVQHRQSSSGNTRYALQSLKEFAGLSGDNNDMPDLPPKKPNVDPSGIPEEREDVENLPPEQPDVDPLKREKPDIEEIEENDPMESPEIDQDERPMPDVDEINPDTNHEIDTNFGKSESGQPIGELSHHYSVEMPLYNGPHSSYLSL
jgi:hypothetical protein